jgi:hypothetical protein
MQIERLHREEIGGRCDLKTGRWEYRKNGAGGCPRPASLPSRLVSGHGSNAFSVPKECSGTRNYRLPFGQAFTNLGLTLSNQPDDHPAGLDPTSAHDLNDGAARSVQHRRQRNCRGERWANWSRLVRTSSPPR